MKFCVTAVSLLLISSCFFTSCSKDKAITNQPGQVSTSVVNEKLLISTSEHYDGTTLEFYPDKRIKQYSYVIPGGSSYRFEFSYSGNTVTDDYFYNNKKFATYFFQLNEKGYMTSCQYTQYDNNGGIALQNMSYYYYNSQGQMIKQSYSIGGHTDFVYDANGNLSEMHGFNVNDVESFVHTYTYYSDKFAKPLSYGQFNSNGLGALQPMFAKNLIKHQVIVDKGSNKVDFDGEYTYTLDADGFVTSGKWVNAVNGAFHSWTSNYQ
jgi:hypothetical protein